MSTKREKLLVLISIILFYALAGCGSNPTVTASPAAKFSLPSTAQLVLSDSLKDNSKGYMWDETTQPSGSCGFSGDVYHIKALAQGVFICNPEAKSLFLGNFSYKINLIAIQGSTEGIAFRFNQTNVTGYIFFIDTQGSYSLSAANGTSTPFRAILSGSSNAIKKGLGQPNVLAVIANSGKISLYINDQFIAQTNDSSYNQGQLGIFTVDSQGPSDIEASNTMAWTL